MSFTRPTVVVLLLGLVFGAARWWTEARLSPDYYARSCPELAGIVRAVVAEASKSDPRIGASLVRLHFHDCFVNVCTPIPPMAPISAAESPDRFYLQGCDGSLLLDNSTDFETEKDAVPNANSVRGFNVVDRIKASVEDECPGIVSCADILAIAAEVSVELGGGPSWRVPFGRRDGLRADKARANISIPAPTLTLDQIKAKFRDVGLNDNTDLVALSGAHTIGRARCKSIVARLYNFSGTNAADPTLDKEYLEELKQSCPRGGRGGTVVNLDRTTPNVFDNHYFSNLEAGQGLLQSDQELISTRGADTVGIVNRYAGDQTMFFKQFAKSMIRMGKLSPLTGNAGEVRLNCRRVNGDGSSSPSSGPDEPSVSSL